MNFASTSALDIFRDVLHYRIFTVGGSALTLEVVLKLLLLCLLVLVVESLLRRYFTSPLLRRTALDAALQYGIARIGGYVFLLFGFYIALTAVGINLSSLAVVAGAVGIGIGFGLQNIIQNFVSGIIILAERPIALGDRIEVGELGGMVSRISLRSTEIVTNDNITIIVPNSYFLTNPVTNWSHGDPKVQFRLPIGVAYESDLDKLRALMKEVADENPHVLKTPESMLYFVAFGDSSLNFELGVWTASMTNSPRRFRSELNFAMEKKLRENKIEIPFPQRDLHIKSGRAPSPPNSPEG